MPVTRAIRVWLAGLRAAAYARLEEIRFRTGVLVLAGAAAVIAVIAAAAVVAGIGGPPAHRPLAGQARRASPSLLVRPPRATVPSRDTARLAPASRRAGSASEAGAGYYYVASRVAHRTDGAPHRDLARRDAFGHRDHFRWPRFGGHGIGRHRGWRHAIGPHHGGRGRHHDD